jgi:hypothetical protein
LFSHYAAEHTHLPAVREACARAGLALDVAGSASGNPCARPEELLGDYDLVFAKARCALEAMAVGCAVVLCDHLGTGPLVRAAEWTALRPLNFGRRACANPLTAECLLAEVARYDAADAAEVCALTRAHAGVGAQADAFLAVYDELIRAQVGAVPDPEGEARAAAEYLRSHLSYPFVTELRGAVAERDHWRAAAAAAHRGWAELRGEYEQVRTGTDDLRAEYERVRAGADELRAECERVRAACAAAQRGWAELRAEYEQVRGQSERMRGQCELMRAAGDELHADYERVRAAAEAAQRGWAELHREYEHVLGVCRRLQASVPEGAGAERRAA